MEHSHPTYKSYAALISDIRNGQIQIPQFQRDFVWTMERSAKLLDSIIKGYPIGTFIFWKTKDRLLSVKKLGGIELRTPEKGEQVNIVLDGQQRLTSLFAALNGLKVARDSEKKEDFSNIYIDLEANVDDKIVTTKTTNLPEKTFIKLTKLLSGNIKELATFPEKYHNKMNEYKRRIESYGFSVIEVFGFSIDVATDVFTRINVSGKTLTVFEIMVAKTYDEKRKFDLSEEYKKLIEELEQFDYQGISNQTVLRLIAQILKNDSKRQAILNLKKNEFIQAWPKAVDSIKQAVACFRGVIGIPVSQLLPYLDLLVLFAYFFHNCSKRPTEKQLKELENLFWQCSLGDRYDAAIDGRLTQDIKRVDQILKNKTPDYDWEIDFSPENLLRRGEFNLNASFTKAILCIMASQQPWSFNNDGIVRTSNHGLSRSNGKNYHRFFPKTFLKENGIDDSCANSVVNIVIAEDYLDKEEIPPSEYIKKYKSKNPKFTKMMKTHLIEDLAKFGILDDDYGTFIQKRAEVISKEIKKRVTKK